MTENTLISIVFQIDRVGISLGLLAGSKLLTVCVPFLFKGAVDTMTTLNMDTAPDAVLSAATALMLGCRFHSLSSLS